MKQIGLLVGVLLLVSCSKDEDAKSNEDKVIAEYLNDNSIDFVKSSGVYQYSIAPNPTGNNNGNVISIYYTLRDLASGTIIDSHLAADGDPVMLLHNSSAVLPIGLDVGLAGAREGESFGIIIPNILGYGNYPTSAIAEEAILHFEIEVVTRQTQADIATAEDLSISNYITAKDLNNTVVNPVDPVEMLTGGVYYKKTGNGDGMAVSVGDSLTINYSGTFLDDSGFDTKTGFKYKYGVGDVLDALDIGVGQMEQGARALLIIPSDKAYGGSVRVIPEAAIDDMVTQFVVPAYAAKVPPFKVLIFDVTLQTIH